MGKNYGSAIVWANGKQHSRLVKFVSESRLTFVQVSFIYRKARRPKTGKFGGFKEIEHEFIFRLEHAVRKNMSTFSDVPLLSRLPLDIEGTVLLFKTIFRY